MYKVLSGILAIGLLVTAFRAYIMRSVDLKNQIVYDGLGRVLSEPPIWAKLLITNENSWAGTAWHFFDIFWFFGGLFFCVWLYSLADDKKQS